MGAFKGICISRLVAPLLGVTVLTDGLQAEGASSSDRSAKAFLLIDRAQKLETAAAGCHEKVRSGELADCKVKITFQRNRLVSPAEAESIAASLRRQARALGPSQPTAAPAPANTPQVQHWNGSWKQQEKEVINKVLSELRDPALRNWIATNIEFNRINVPNSYRKTSTSDMIGVSGSTLNFNDGFFLSPITDINGFHLESESLNARRENLTAFEAGKAFYARMKDKPLKEGESLGAWFARYEGPHEAAILATKSVPHKHDGLAEVHDPAGDMYSGFGYLFRMQALKLGVTADFQQRVDWLLERNR